MDLYAAIILIVVASSIWVAVDAPARGLSATWALGCLALWIVAFPWYLMVRTQQIATLKTSRATKQTPVAGASWQPDPRSPQTTERWREGERWTSVTRPRQS